MDHNFYFSYFFMFLYSRPLSLLNTSPLSLSLSLSFSFSLLIHLFTFLALFRNLCFILNMYLFLRFILKVLKSHLQWNRIFYLLLTLFLLCSAILSVALTSLEKVVTTAEEERGLLIENGVVLDRLEEIFGSRYVYY